MSEKLWLCEALIDWDKEIFVTVHLLEKGGNLMIEFSSGPLGSHKAVYSLSQVAIRLLKRTPFPVCTVEGEPIVEISLNDLQRICERALYSMEEEGMFLLTFTEHDMSIPF